MFDIIYNIKYKIKYVMILVYAKQDFTTLLPTRNIQRSDC